MYPYFRMFKELWKYRQAPALGILDAHISTHRIWPFDLDPWMELNNGRTLTLFDLGRIPLGKRTGLHHALRENGWGLTVAGNSTRYRRRVTLFQRLTQVSRAIGWDDRFIYLEQSFWRGEECTAHMLLRMAVISKGGMIAPERVLTVLGADTISPDLPQWVQNWIAADSQRPWPPKKG